jgi:hypothetical protein
VKVPERNASGSWFWDMDGRSSSDAKTCVVKEDQKYSNASVYRQIRFESDMWANVAAFSNAY